MTIELILFIATVMLIFLGAVGLLLLAISKEKEDMVDINEDTLNRIERSFFEQSYLNHEDNP